MASSPVGRSNIQASLWSQDYIKPISPKALHALRTLLMNLHSPNLNVSRNCGKPESWFKRVLSLKIPIRVRQVKTSRRNSMPDSFLRRSIDFLIWAGSIITTDKMFSKLPRYRRSTANRMIEPPVMVQTS